MVWVSKVYSSVIASTAIVLIGVVLKLPKSTLVTRGDQEMRGKFKNNFSDKQYIIEF